MSKIIKNIKLLADILDVMLDDACVWFTFQPTKKKFMIAITAYTLNAMVILWLF
jgi:hypothetical protein